MMNPGGMVEAQSLVNATIEAGEKFTVSGDPADLDVVGKLVARMVVNMAADASLFHGMELPAWLMIACTACAYGRKTRLAGG
jgi:hypothetical protein